ncbi:MAG: LD-carboxypeptidase [Bacteroidetes bacterium]|nr:LD-carboxypeptidase [Bacteroidota bacterium]MBU1373293.1 LD-carboxypeptidase [Bacteroidota bacterium]MBU1485657.1 LD-carboxypeptidase [Bacteroidota bacterium]MBU1761648.1 LD-carboxypeptidase [Bacteroidota bacterium]MBU2045631.1 LD-carboxypeptidase [Bacteroidota bacterium]
MIQPQFLKKGDKIAITCPAKSLKTPMTAAIQLLEAWGLEVVLGETVDAVFHQFSGTDELRAKDMQRFIDDGEIKAIIAARGGYGCIRIVDDIDWTPLLKNPKWVIGFSDITVFHLQLQSMGIQSIHGQMPSTIPDSTSSGLESLRKSLFGDELTYEIPAHPKNKTGNAKGELIGGNLSLLTACLNSVSDFDYLGKILFIEEVGEYHYTIDRMMRTLDRAGKLKNLAGLILGGFTSIKEDEPFFGWDAYEIVDEIVSKYSYPVCYDFPAGHIKNNCALIFGKDIELNVAKDIIKLNYR